MNAFCWYFDWTCGSECSHSCSCSDSRPLLLDVIEANVTSLERRPILRLRVYSGSLASGSRAVSPCSSLILKSFVCLSQASRTELLSGIHAVGISPRKSKHSVLRFCCLSYFKVLLSELIPYRRRGII